MSEFLVSESSSHFLPLITHDIQYMTASQYRTATFFHSLEQ